MNVEHYQITGMSCASCSARVEKAVSAVPGVSHCAVNLLTNSMEVDGTAKKAEVIAAVKRAGYGVKTEETTASPSETAALIRRLILSVCFLIPLIYISMGHDLFGWYLPPFLEKPAVNGCLQLALSFAVVLLNRRFFISGVKAAWHKAPNMDTLVALGAGASFIYSTVRLFFRFGTKTELYFESTAMILTLITVGKLLEAHAKGKTTNALSELMRLTPELARKIVDGKEIDVRADELEKGDRFAVKPGEVFPADGVILSGSGAVSEAAISGESVPVDKKEGDPVTAATINLNGYMICEVKNAGNDTALSKILELVSDAASGKAPIARIADRVSAIFVPAVLLIAAVTFAVWMLCGQTVGFSLSRAIAVLLISCPCALGLATPVAIMVGSGVGARNGILFKTAAALEMAGKIDIVVLDKTGTVTRGEMTVDEVYLPDGVRQEELCDTAYALEWQSEHPLAKAVCRYAERKGRTREEVTDFKAYPGNGLSAVYKGKKVTGGSLSFIGEKMALPDEALTAAQQMADRGKTPMLFLSEDRFLGILAASDEIKKESAEAISRLKEDRKRVVLLTGDEERVAESVGKAVGITERYAGVLPDGKDRIIRDLKKEGRVAMVGDGINDAVALTRADLGIAIGAGTDVALDAADVILIKNDLTDVPRLLSLGRATGRTIYENLFWAFLYNVIGIPVAAGCFIASFGWRLDPMLSAAAMSLSSFCVVSNALRLNLFKSKRKKERKEMNVTLTIEGMMCEHCEARVKACLLAVPGVTDASVSHKENKAVVTADEGVLTELLKEAVEAQGYHVVD